MTRTFQAKFDGKAIVPETPVDLPQNQRLTLTVESAQPLQTPNSGTVADFLKQFNSKISGEDAEAMRRALREAERVGSYRSISGREFLEALKKVKISHEDIALMNKAVEEGCEQVDDAG